MLMIMTSLVHLPSRVVTDAVSKGRRTLDASVTRRYKYSYSAPRPSTPIAYTQSPHTIQHNMNASAALRLSTRTTCTKHALAARRVAGRRTFQRFQTTSSSSSSSSGASYGSSHIAAGVAGGTVVLLGGK